MMICLIIKFQGEPALKLEQRTENNRCYENEPLIENLFGDA